MADGAHDKDVGKKLTRRDAAWLIARATAAAGGADFLRSWAMAATSAPPAPDRWTNYRPAFFTAEEYRILDNFAAILIPTGETPGAREAHVAPFIDFVVNAAAEFAPETQADWHGAMRWLGGKNFAKLSAEQQTALIAEMAGPERDPAAEHDGYATYRLIKDMTVRAFYTSRAGLIENLEYQGNAYLAAFPPCNHPEHRKV